MVNKKCIITVALLLCFLGLYAQEPPKQQEVNVQFSEVALGAVLQQLEEDYQLQFSYLNNHLPLEQLITFESSGKSLENTLKALFEDNGIACAKIGQQWALKRKPIPLFSKSKVRQQRKKARQQQRKKRDEATLKRERLFDIDIHSELSSTDPKEEQLELPIKSLIDPIEVPPVVVDSIGGTHTPTWEEYKEETFVEPGQKRPPRTRFGQITLVPFIGTNGRYLTTHNVLSFNVFWGINGGVNGLELGGIGNTIQQNVHGIQVAGGFNAVNGHLFGIQLAGLFNITRRDVGGAQISPLWNMGRDVHGLQISLLSNISRDFYGLQLSGLSNIARHVYGWQIGGFVNFANGKLSGVQLAGLGNITWGGKSAVQFAGFFNVSAKAQFQLALLLNATQEVEGAQLGVINAATKVKGVQAGVVNNTKDLVGAQVGLVNHAACSQGLMLGLVNIVDSIKGIPIGIINIVKNNGYNRLEVSGGDALYFNFGAKFGAKRLYQIAQLGWRIGADNVYSWALGMGIGTNIPISKRSHINFELLALHLNEGVFWTTELNLLNQFKTTIDFNLNERVSLFIGPVFNVQVSKLYDNQRQLYGTHIAPYTFFDATNNGTNVQLWLGGTAGVRF